MAFPANKTKIVCTIGPASDSQDILERLIRAGMNVARLNFSHGDFAEHQAVIRRIRAASRATGRRVAIMADLPGPKIRLGQFAEEPVKLRAGDTFTLTTEEIEGTVDRVSVTFAELPQAVRPGNRLFLNDGLIQLKVLESAGREVRCEVLIGGQLSSRKGLNLPGIDLGISAFTDHDRHCLAFALENGVDAISQSFVENTTDIAAVRKAAADLGHDPFLIAKIERSGALDHIDDILQAADGIMVARGDLGVEIPIAQIAIVQKQLIWKANRLGKPVITATQMLESMTTNRRPTRAEATDVANAVLDGTDAVMLSGESAMGQFPVDAAEMLATIAANIEPLRTVFPVREELSASDRDKDVSLPDLIARSVVDHLPADHPRRRHRSDPQRGHRPPHHALQAAGLDYGGEQLREDLSGPALFLRCFSGLRAGTPDRLAVLDSKLAQGSGVERSLGGDDRRPVPQTP